MTKRRDFLKLASMGGVATAIQPQWASGNEIAKHTKQQAKRSLRIAHITDVHLLNQKNAELHFARVLHDINFMEDKPDLIINTGDSIMNAHCESREIVAARWDVWNKIITSNKIPMASALGNHDVWTGPNKIVDIKYKSDARYGKAWAMEMLNMPNRYYSFEKCGWKFIALDSINDNSGYQLDEAQFHWLGNELANSAAPVCIFNHVPILSMGAVLYSSKRTVIKKLKFPAGDMHKDHQRLKDAFQQHQNVKLALSGHVHYIDAIEYLGVKYLCNGAVSGNWWGNPISLDEFPPVYAVIDLYEDGSIRHEMIYYYNDNV